MKRVLVFGVFDGVHEGHLAFLRQARTYADFTRTNAEEKVLLVAAVARDEVVRKLKGKFPNKDSGQRKKELLNTGLVDEVIEGDMDLGGWGVIGKVKPDIIALGYDQVGLKDALEEHIRERSASRRMEIEVVVMKAYKPEKFHSSLIHARH